MSAVAPYTVRRLPTKESDIVGTWGKGSRTGRKPISVFRYTVGLLPQKRAE